MSSTRSRPRVLVVDYGSGNLYSVRRALESCGADADIDVSADPAALATADRLVVPGVGAFADAMHGFTARGWVEPVRRYAASGRPLLGICVGMQMLMAASEEFGVHEGLGLIPGRVVAIPRQDTDGARLKVPSIGWTPIEVADGAPPSLRDHPAGGAVYLVHSFHALPDDPRHRVATYAFGVHAVTAAVARDNILGLQFHPEKSGAAGLAIMRRFVAA
jgi:glutamine amidotransferase